MTLALTLLLYPLIQGREAGWPSWTFVCIAAFLPLLYVFVRFEKLVMASGGSPLMELSLFHNRVFVIGLFSGVCFFSGSAAFFLVSTVFVQNGLGYSAREAGLTFLWFAIAFLGSSLASVRVQPKLGSRIINLGAALMIIGLSGLLWITAGRGAALSGLDLAPVLLIYGTGQGFVMPTLINTILINIKGHDAGSASGILYHGPAGFVRYGSRSHRHSLLQRAREAHINRRLYSRLAYRFFGEHLPSACHLRAHSSNPALSSPRAWPLTVTCLFGTGCYDMRTSIRRGRPHITMGYLLGFLIACAVGLTGVGAGGVSAPILILFFHLKPATAVGTALTFAAVIKLAVLPIYLRRQQVNYRVLLLLCAGGIPGVMIGIQLLKKLSVEDHERGIFLVLGISPSFSSHYSTSTDRCGAGLPKLRQIDPCGFRPLPRSSGPRSAFSSAGAGALGAVVLLSLTQLTPALVVGTDMAFGLTVSTHRQRPSLVHGAL